MARYQYSAIDTSSSEPHIRLLKLQGGIDSEIRGELFDAYLDDENLIPYEAISYTWGLKSCLEIDIWKIWIGDEIIAITENAYQVLDHLRYPEMDRIVWIDSICINQGNKAERSHQVQQMAQIYTCAEKVHIWLCNSSKISSPIMESLRKLAVQIQKAKAPHNDREYARHWSTVQCESKLISDNFEVRHRRSLARLLRLPWFRRVWILQEVANAKRTEVHCGLNSVPGSIFAIAPELVGLKPDSHCQAVLDLMKKPERRPSWWSEDRDLFALMKRFGASEASEDRDHVYALLGMCTDPGLEIDYTARTENVIWQTIAHIYRLPLDLISTMAPSYGTVKGLRSHIHSAGNYLLESLAMQGFTDVIPDLVQLGRGVRVTLDLLSKVSGGQNEQNCREKMLRFLSQLQVAKEVTPESLIDAIGKKSVGEKYLNLLLQDANTKVRLNENALLFVAQHATPETMTVIFSRPVTTAITEGVLHMVATYPTAGTEGVLYMVATYATPQVMALILSKPSVTPRITENILHKVVERATPETLALIISQPVIASRITEHVLYVAAGHSVSRISAIHLERMKALFGKYESKERITPMVVRELVRNLGPMWPITFPFDHEGAREAVKRCTFLGTYRLYPLRSNTITEQVNLPFHHGHSEMSLAAVCGDIDNVQRLVEWGRDINATDEFGWTALRYATEMGHSDLINWLELHGAVIIHYALWNEDDRG